MTTHEKRLADEDYLTQFADEIRHAVNRFACRLIGTSDEREDLEAAVRLALVTAVRSYRPDRGATLRTYVIVQLHYAAQEFVRESRRSNRVHHFEEIPASQLGAEGDPLDLAACTGSLDGPDAVRICLYDALADALAALPERDREIILARAGGATFPEVATAHGVSKSRVRQLQIRALERLRIALADWA